MRSVGSDEEDVHAVDRGELGGVLDRRRILDLHDEREPTALRADIAMPDPPEFCAARQQGNPPHTVGVVADERDGVAHLGRRLEPGHHDAGRAQVERPAHPQAGVHLDADERGHAGGLGRIQLRKQVGLRARSVLEVDEQPVKAGKSGQLNSLGRTEVQERADEQIAAQDPFAEPDPSRFVCHACPSLVCRPRARRTAPVSLPRLRRRSVG